LARFQIKPFESEAVVFDAASGDTHFLAPLTLELFRIVQNNPGMTAGEIDATLASRLSLSVGPHLTQLAADALASLRRIGLLETP
jgi:PqqD family protein of HPr-rel-A system